jgi:hypothetical protein
MWDLHPKMIALTRDSSNLNVRSVLPSERAPHISKPAPDNNKNLALGSSCVLDTKTDWLTVNRNITFESDFEFQLVIELLGFSHCQMLLRSETVREPR